MFKQIFIAAILMGALGAVVTTLSSTAQLAHADKVGPNGAKEDQITQGALGEFYSKEGRAIYYPEGTTGHDFGDQRSDLASSLAPHGAIGSNTAFYGSGECHGKVPAACLP